MFNLRNHHTFALNSHCRKFYEFHHLTEIQESSLDLSGALILGGGSNIVFLDDFEGDIVTYRAKDIVANARGNHWELIVDSGVVWHELVEFTVMQGMGGLENLALIPGLVGAAPVQNIGAYGVEFSEFCGKVIGLDLVTRELRSLSAEECEFKYRGSIFKQPGFKQFLITKLHLRLPRSWSPKLTYKGLETLPKTASPAEVMDKIVSIRKSKLPAPEELPNSGSFFKNPIVTQAHLEELKQIWPDIPCFGTEQGKVKLSAGWLIEKAGFKGINRKGIGTYRNHALVLVNRGNGSGTALLELIDEITAKLHSLFAVELEPEVLLVGKNGVISL